MKNNKLYLINYITFYNKADFYWFVSLSTYLAFCTSHNKSYTAYDKLGQFSLVRSGSDDDNYVKASAKSYYAKVNATKTVIIINFFIILNVY